MRENSIEPDLPIMSALVSAFGAANNIDGVRSATHSALKLENVDGRLFVDIICAFTTCGAYQEALDIFHSSKYPKNIQTCTAGTMSKQEAGRIVKRIIRLNTPWRGACRMDPKHAWA